MIVHELSSLGGGPRSLSALVYIVISRWKSESKQYLQFFHILYNKLLTNCKQQFDFSLERYNELYFIIETYL